MQIMRGDAYNIEIVLTDEMGEVISAEGVENAEFVLGGTRKTLRDGIEEIRTVPAQSQEVL